uniref:Reverse transcriptase domain-containing protein n=1 Tax=Fagus sylvatica TaxID=28930 RepID=A0A2N9H7K0_FAGSY
MALSRYNDPLMCRLFPSSLGEVALRWFNQLGRRTISSWIQMAEAFVSRFITNSRKTKEMDALLTMKLKDNETIKEYSTRFWETYNDIDGCDEKVVVRTFKLGLLPDTGLRQSLTKRPAPTAGKLMHRIDQFIQVEEDGVFKEPIYKLMEKIKREPFFVWPPKLLGNPALRDGKLYCTYHKDMGHMTENCHMLKVHLEKLVSAGHLNQYVDTNLTNKKESSQATRQPHSLGVASVGVIHVIHNPLCSIISSGSYRSEIQRTAHLRRSFSIIDSVHPAPICSVSKGAVEQTISFSNNDLKDVQLPHNDSLVITLRIGNYDVQRILIDQRSFAEVMYQDLYTKLGLGEADLTSFTSPIFGFSREPIVPLGGTVLPVLAGPINLRTKFIVVRASSPYNAIMRLYDALGVSPDLACHVLNISVEHKPVAQKRRKLAPERAAIVLEEVERFLESRAIREVQYPIPMSAADQEKTTFITPRGAYCYKVTPFGLKNAGATYQRMVTKMFRHIIRKTVEVYIDDMLIKSFREEDHAANQLQVFGILRGSHLRLNASKCTFGVSSGKFLGYMPLDVSIQGRSTNANLSFDSWERGSNFSRRITKWGVHLGSLDVEYKPRTAIKGQILTDFLAEFQYDPSNPSLLLPDETQLGLITGRWELFVDGASNSKGSGAGIVLVSPKGLVLEQAVRLKFSCIK